MLDLIRRTARIAGLVLLGIVLLVVVRRLLGGGGGDVPLALDEPVVPPPPEPEGGWVAPEGQACPAHHPVKAKESSGIFHAPEGAMYERTIPDRCYTSAEAAEADGFRASKR